MRTSRIKILFLIDSLLPGGTENQLILLAESLPLDLFKPRIGILAKTDYAARLATKTPVVDFSCRWDFPLLRSFCSLWKLHRYLSKEAFDILQAHVVYATIYGAWAKRICSQRPILVTTRRNLYHWVEQAPILFRFFRHTIRWTDHVLVNSHKVFEEAQKREGIPREKLTLIPNAIEISKFKIVSQEAAKKNIGLAGEFPVIGVVGNLRVVKGLVPFLEAASQVSSQLPTARFVIVGNGPQENTLRAWANDLAIEDRVTFLKDISEIHEILPAFDVAVQPSLSESFSNVLLEYMAAARPIVATRVGDAEMVLKDGTEGFLVKPGNPDDLATAILKLCHDRDMATNFGRLARKKVMANWDSKNILKSYQNFYEELLGQEESRN